MAGAAFAYDAVAYPTAVVGHMTPDRIRAGGQLYGWQGPDPATASVLEIGCGDGLNLIAMATVAPGATHVGFDLSEQAIARGRELVRVAGLANVTLEPGDITSWPRTGRKFDYIVCHGVYAWVPDFVQRALIELIGALLAPGGVAYVSYDALPAAAAKVELQHYLVRKTAGIDGMEARVKAAAGILGTLSRHQVDDSRLAPQFEVLAKSISGFDAAYFFHDWLSECYAPPSLSGFAAAAAEFGLKVAGDAGLTDLFINDLDDEATALLGEDGDWAGRGEALDFLRGAQMFRRTYLVRADAPPPATTSLDGLWFSFDGAREAETDDKTGQQRWRYSADMGTFLIPTTPEQTAVMEVLWQARPGERAYAEIVSLIGNEDAVDAVLRRVCTLGLVSAHAAPPLYVLTPGEKPVASPLLRAMFASGPTAVTLRHTRLIPKEPPTGTFLTLCDGTRDRAALAEDMSARFGVDLSVAKIDEAISDLAPRRVFLA